MSATKWDAEEALPPLPHTKIVRPCSRASAKTSMAWPTLARSMVSMAFNSSTRYSAGKLMRKYSKPLCRAMAASRDREGPVARPAIVSSQLLVGPLLRRFGPYQSCPGIRLRPEFPIKILAKQGMPPRVWVNVPGVGGQRRAIQNTIIRVQQIDHGNVQRIQNLSYRLNPRS